MPTPEPIGVSAPMPMTTPRRAETSSFLLYRPVDLSEQAQKLVLVPDRESLEMAGEHCIVLWNDFVVDLAALISQEQTIDTSVGPALEQSSAFHFVQELADVAFCYQQRVG
jgi:hypothetical protein